MNNKIKKVIVRVKGGLGNQMFCYAAARRLAYVNNAELVIDTETGFSRDLKYKRTYALGNFNISARKATTVELMKPFERVRRGIVKYVNRCHSFQRRSYIEQDGDDFDSRLLNLKINKTVYLDGLWQSEKYFKDIEGVIRNDFKISLPEDTCNQDYVKQIQNSEALCIHIRILHNIQRDYYKRSIEMLKRNIPNLKIFVFSDYPKQSRNYLNEESAIFIANNDGEKAYIDILLMSQCKYFIIANSTFSWWGAWLSNYKNKIVISPEFGNTDVSSWGFEGLIPEGWIIL